jgi:hypothetical protein
VQPAPCVSVRSSMSLPSSSLHLFKVPNWHLKESHSSPDNQSTKSLPAFVAFVSPSCPSWCTLPPITNHPSPIPIHNLSV